jgi:hypothetical protein
MAPAQARVTGRSTWEGSALRFLVAVAVAGAAALLLFRATPRDYRAHSDIVGYPAWADFNMDRYFAAYEIGVVVFPILALLLFVVLTWVSGRAGLSSRTAANSAPESTSSSEEVLPRARLYLIQLGRIAVAGAVLGVEIAIVRSTRPTRMIPVVVLAMAAYSILITAIAAGLHRLRRDRFSLIARLSTVNALAIPLSFFGLLAVSAATVVQVTSTGEVHRYPWLPLWLAALGSLVVLLLIVVALSRANSEARLQVVEQRALLIVAGSIGLFLFIAVIPGDIGFMDVFHEGEGLVPAQLATHGWLPWRDLMSIHGPLQDTLRSLFGLLVFEPSRWGAWAGNTVVLYPLYVVALYLVFAYLFRQSWPFLVASVVLLLGNAGAPDNFRFWFWPLILILLGGMLVKPSLARIGGFTFALIAEVILSPESIFTLPACGIVILLYEVYHFDRTRGLMDNFRRTIGCSIAGLIFVVIFFFYLVSQHAVGDFFFFYRIIAEGRTSGGLPFHLRLEASPTPLLDRFVVVAMPASILIGFWYVVAKLRMRRPFDIADWVMAAAGLHLLLYFQKFLARADGHLYQPYTVAFPFLLYVVYKAITPMERWIRKQHRGAWIGRIATRHPLGVLVLLLALTTFPSLPTKLVTVPQNYRADAATPPWLPALGYAAPDAVERTRYADVDQFLRAYLKPGDPVFDFSNESGLYFYLLGYTPATRYYHVSIAIPEDAQQDLIARLRTNRPKIVVYTNDALGLPGWDGIANMVRHYDVSQYILDNYRPLAIVHGQMLFADVRLTLPDPSSLGLKLTQPLIKNDLLFRAGQCDWAYQPNFFSVTPNTSADKAPLTLALQPSAESAAQPGQSPPIQLTLPAGAHWTDYQWMEIDTRSKFRGDQMLLYDVVSHDLSRQIAFRTLETSPQRYLVRVGSCPQWHGYRGSKLVIAHGSPQDISAVRLIP